MVLARFCDRQRSSSRFSDPQTSEQAPRAHALADLFGAAWRSSAQIGDIQGHGSCSGKAKICLCPILPCVNDSFFSFGLRRLLPYS